MFRRTEDATRLGIRILVTAALAGLVVLLCQGRARSAEGMTEEDSLQALLEPSLASPGASLEEAEALLQHDRRARWGSALNQVADLAWKTGSEPSVRGMVSGAKGLYRTARTFRAHTPMAHEALALLDAQVRAGAVDERLRSLHAELLEREQSEQLERRVGRVSRALDQGNLERARVRLRSLREFAPMHPKLRSLEDALSDLDRERQSERDLLLQVSSESRPGETALVAALLLGDVGRVCSASSAQEGASLLCAAGLYGGGARQDARARLENIAEGEGAVASTAARWLADPHMYPEGFWRQARRRSRVRRLLGWLGGETLEERGMDLSSRALGAWRAAASPLNLAIAAPLRILRRRPSDPSDLRRAARFYLEHAPRGSAAAEAREWLGRTGPSSKERRRWALYRDGMLEIPRARTHYTPVFARPVLVTAALLHGGDGTVRGALFERFAPAEALLLTPGPARDSTNSVVLPREQAISALRELADAIEEGRALPVAGTGEGAIDALRRCEGVLRKGWVLHVRSWDEPSSGSESKALLAVLEGDSAEFDHVAAQRGRDDLSVRRRLLGSNLRCPSGVVCLDQVHPVEGSLYGQLGVDGDARFGMETRIQGASLRVEMSDGGPHASLVLPVGALLGIGRWVPIQASVGISLAGITVAPGLESGHSAKD